MSDSTGANHVSVPPHDKSLLSSPHTRIGPYSDYFPLDTTEWSGSKLYWCASKIENRELQMQRSNKVVHEVAHFSKYNFSPNVIPDAASINSVWCRKKKKKREKKQSGVPPRHLHACLLCPTITIIHFTHHMRIQITKMVARFDVRRKEVSSNAIFITSFIPIIILCADCENFTPTQPHDVRLVFEHVCRSACKTNHNLGFNIFYILEKDFCHSNLMWISDELCLRNRI